jgi:hypothetical protein
MTARALPFYRTLVRRPIRFSLIWLCLVQRTAALLIRNKLVRVEAAMLDLVPVAGL